jgi:hypothetical protein
VWGSNEDVEHVVYGYNDALPRAYITNLENKHCPLNENATKDASNHYFRGWMRNQTHKPEGLNKLKKND